MGEIDKKFKELKKQKKSVVISWAIGKFSFGLGLGLLIANYFNQYDFTWFGIGFILLAILVSVPMMCAVLGK